MALLRATRPRRLGHDLARAVVVAVLGTIAAAAVLPVLSDAPVPAIPVLPSGPSAGAALDGTDSTDSAGPGRTTLPAAAVGALMDRYRCSTGRLDPEATPRSALVRIDDGLRVVDFERGWRIFTEHGPSALAAVCLLPPD